MSSPQVTYQVDKDSPSIHLMQCPIAGFQYHGGEACWGRIRINDRLTLQREPGNRHDPRAITVSWRNVMLGYVPREANFALSQLMDRGAHVEGRVKALREGPDPWQRVMMEIMVRPAASAPAEPTTEVERTVLWPPLELPAPRLEPAPAIGAFLPAQREKGLAVLRDCVPEIAARLARPVLGIHGGGGREVRLWDTVALEIDDDGRGLHARYLEAPAGSEPPPTTVDLKLPLGRKGWMHCFTPLIAAVCSRHGLTREMLVAPLQRWIGDSLDLTFAGCVQIENVRKAVLAFLAPDPLARSLANRIFGPSPEAQAFNWVCGRIPALALCGVEHPAMLPFLRLVQDDKAMRTAADPLAALQERLLAEKLEPAAWKKLERWGFGTFRLFGPAWWKPIPFARFANLLHHLGVDSPPPRDFVMLALTIAQYRIEQYARLNFERHPLWFVRAVLRERERVSSPSDVAALHRELLGCLDWMIEARPNPDANQQHAGWPWILEQARAHRAAKELARAAPWPVPPPVAEMAWGPYRVVAIGCLAELAAEAEAMKNCLLNDEDACRSGAVVVYSIRERSTGKRIACFAAGRGGRGGPWKMVEIAGKMNAPVDEEIARIGHAMVAKMNGGR